MIGIAVLGCGRIGGMHAANIAAHPRVRLATVYDIHAPASEATAYALGAPVADSIDAVLADPAVDAVLIATAAQTHAELIERAVAAGKPVLCEKPIDLDLARVNECATKIGGSAVPIQLGFNRRFDPSHRGARDAVRKGEIGTLRQVVITSRDPGLSPRAYLESSGGLFKDMTIHDFDLARFLLEEEPTELFATASRLVDPPMMDEIGDHDSAMIILRTESGVLCSISNSRAAAYGYDQRVEILGSAGMVQSANRKRHELRRFSAAHTDVSEPYQHFFVDRYEESFRAEISAFVDAIEQGVAPEVGFEDGRRALILAEAACLSVREGRAVSVREVA